MSIYDTTCSRKVPMLAKITSGPDQNTRIMTTSLTSNGIARFYKSKEKCKLNHPLNYNKNEKLSCVVFLGNGWYGDALSMGRLGDSCGRKCSLMFAGKACQLLLVWIFHTYVHLFISFLITYNPFCFLFLGYNLCKCLI